MVVRLFPPSMLHMDADTCFSFAVLLMQRRTGKWEEHRNSCDWWTCTRDGRLCTFDKQTEGILWSLRYVRLYCVTGCTTWLFLLHYLFHCWTLKPAGHSLWKWPCNILESESVLKKMWSFKSTLPPCTQLWCHTIFTFGMKQVITARDIRKIEQAALRQFFFFYKAQYSIQLHREARTENLFWKQLAEKLVPDVLQLLDSHQRCRYL